MIRKADILKAMLDLKNNSRRITVAIEGNIGSGKTTFLSHFSTNKNVEVVEEPVSQWQNVGGQNLLKLLYEDPRKWGFCFQTQVQLSMLQNHTLVQSKPVKMLERSLHSARHCFVENLYQTGMMCSEQTAVLDIWYKWLCLQGLLNVNLFIYLRTSPQVVLQRVIARARLEEKSSITLELLQRLHNLHEEWLLNASSPVLILDGNKPLKDMEMEFKRCNQYLQKFLH